MDAHDDESGTRLIVKAEHRYEIVAVTRSGHEHHHWFAADTLLREGDLLTVAGDQWLVDRIEPEHEAAHQRVVAKPARYRLVLRHPDGHEEVTDPRELHGGALPLGHAFVTVVDRQELSWQVIDRRMARDQAGGPFLECVAERDFAEVESVPVHELEHELVARAVVPPAMPTKPESAERERRTIEIVALETGEAPDWSAAASYIDALVLEELEDDLIEMCGVDPDHELRDSWLAIVKQRLRSDLRRFRNDIEGDRSQIEQWEFRGTRLFVSTGSWRDEKEGSSRHGWMCRLADSGALAAAGFEHVRKADLWELP